MSLRALLFDVDGTLADTEEAHRLAFNAAFAELGLPWRWERDLYRTLLAVTGGKERIRHYAARHDAAFAAAPDPDARIARIHRVKTRHFVRAVEAGAVPLRPGIARLFDEAAAEGLMLAIATTTTWENVRALLEAQLGKGALDRFAVVAAGDCVPRKKPAPDIYVLALERLGVPAADCLAFEDSANGLRAALGAGLATVITPSAYTEGEDFTGALAVLPQLGDPERPLAAGTPGAPRVDLATLRAWHRGAPGRLGTASGHPAPDPLTLEPASPIKCRPMQARSPAPDRGGAGEPSRGRRGA